ncbi:hypothetical protein SADUNF_Sadunf08G0105700 [Salix dunnii]|uniref:Uncharacterized protein n=1 Tax=Salix dunnii TaxID=1413687 RepID=A0A835MUQ3_9ROSI|nr:hypothetical protein SADUNF_Sadunf08G0105700 [Salix dunnii]
MLRLCTSFTQNSESGNSRLHPGNKSEMVPRVKKFESPSSRSKRVEPISHPSTNRTKQNASSIKPDTRPSVSAFSFKSDERAERRKEDSSVLYEVGRKWYAMEAEMNQIQAKTQASLSKTNPAKAQHKSTSPASGAAARPQLLSRAGNDQALSANKCVKRTNQHEPSGRTDPPPAKVSETLYTSRTNNSRHKPEALTKTDLNGKNERHRVSENNEVPKDLKFEGKEKMGNHRSSSGMLRKSIKRIGIGSNSGKGHLAVSVAS